MGDNYEITNESEIHSVDNIVSIASEEDILQETSKQIEDLFKEERKLKNLQCEIKNQNEESITENKDRDDKNKLQKQAKTNDIISLEAIAKHSNTQQGGIFNKPSHLLDFEKYLQRQAELAKQKKQFKRYISCEKEKDAIPLKKAKVEVPCSNKRRNVKKSERKKESAKSSSKVVSCNNSESENDRLRKINTKKLLNNNSNSKVNSSSTLNSLEPDVTNDSDSEYFPSDNVDSDEEDKKYATKKKKEKYSKLKCTKRNIKRILDDGDEKIYKQRVIAGNYLRNKSLHSIDNLFKVPQSIWKKLYRYQKVSVLWLWELHGRNLGGLLGDEMGLGKTVQVIAFLAGLDCSELLSDGGRFRGLGPTLIVCPATLMEQWVMHFHEWWPILRVAVLHHSGTYDVNPQILIDSLKTGGVLVTSYSGVLIHQNLLVSTQWHYVILDEGHKIRNPEAKVSKVVKQFSTPHRLLLSGSPMQNSLKELWSLFDFILPGKLGTLPAFLEHCAIPITRGGYANATPLQEATALHVAIILKDAIAPYMLRRTKVDVNHCVNLPEKNEQVLFCSLTDEQTKLYKRYLYSEDISFILHEKNCLRESGTYKARLLIALSALRKICNHPDLFLYTNQTDSDEDITLAEESLKKFGYWKRAGKMIVVQSLLKIWKRQGHRVLLFTQGRQMMHVLESLLQHENYSYLRMDGTTPTSQRQQTIHTFNNNPTYFIFLLTTRVGGLGVNLTGANRVIIYDPDWNPATDAQARERAWRIGQNKKVTVYRLITAGTIEEKIYHRQIFKLLLSNKVLHDPRQRRVFKTTDLAELFNLYEPMDGKTSESDLLFRNSKLTPTEMFSPSKLEKMRQLASTLSKNICKNTVVDMTLPESTSENGTDKEMQSNSVSSKNSVIDIELPENHTLHNDEKNVQNLENNNMINQANINKESKNIENTSQDSTGEITSTISHISNNEVKGPITHNERSIDVEAAKRKIRYKHKRNKNMTKKNDNVSAIFEGERVSCLIGKRMINSPTDKSVEISDDNYVLKKLFAKSSITSAFQHESVLSSAQHDSDNVTPMQRLARESAQESMNFVRSSRKWCTIPRWDKTLPGDD